MLKVEQDQRKNIISVFCIIFAVIMLLLSIAGLVSLGNSVILTLWGEVAEGTVVENKISHVRQKTIYCPVISFETADGKEIKFTQGVGPSDSPIHEKGDKLKVIYSKSSPGKAKIYNFKVLFLSPFFAVMFCFFLAGLAIFFLIHIRQEEKS